jgi:nitrogen fixation-related uncharacterized protein
MRVYINEQFLKRTRRLSTILFFASLAILGGGLAISYSVNYANTILLMVPVVAMPVGLLTTWWSVRLSNQYVRKPHPEDVLQEAFKSAGAHSVSYHYLFKAKHVLVCAQGVYVIVTRFQEGLFRGRNEKVVNARGGNPIGFMVTLMRQEQMGDPIKEAQTAADELEALLVEYGIHVPVQPLIVFTSEKAQLEVEGEMPIPILLTNPVLKKGTLKALLKGERKREATLSPNQLNEIETALNAGLALPAPESANV